MGWLELSIMGGYFLLILAVGWIKGRKEDSLEDYFVGGRRVPWWAVLGSLVATEVSAATFLAVPGVGFSENMTYLQFGIGSFFARIFVATIFIGIFYQAKCLSIYEYLGKRFGDKTHYTASVYFLMTRIMASGVRLMIAVTGFTVILGWSFGWSLLLFGIITLVYTSIGGIRAVIWTDCIQAIIFLSAGLACVGWILSETGGAAIWAEATAANRLEVLRLMPEDSGTWGWLNDSKWFFTAVFFGFVSTVAALGTDQDMAQRLLASRSAALAKRSLIASGVIALPVAALFLFIGVSLYGYFQLNPDPALPSRIIDGVTVVDGDKAFSYFITTGIPAWLRGLLLAGVLAAAMSSLDSAMAALSTSTVRDIIQPLLKKEAFLQHKWVWVSRLCTVIFASILMGTAWFLREGGTFLWLAFKITSLTYGSLLGVFLLGRFSRRGTDRGNLVAMLSGTVIACAGLYFIEAEKVALAWTWLLPLGATVTFAMGAIPRNRRNQVNAGA